MKNRKKDVELWRLLHFKKLISDFPNGQINPSEEPDFLVHEDSKVIGIELTDLHRGISTGKNLPQALEAMRNRVVTRAREIYESLANTPVYVTFFLNDQISIKKGEIEDIATDLVRIVSTNLAACNAPTEISIHIDDPNTLPLLVRCLKIRRLEGLKRSYFSNPSSTWVGVVEKEDIEKVLLKKESKVVKYRSKCDQIWLVINSDIEPMSTWVEFDTKLLETNFPTKFDRVYLVQHFRNAVHLLNVHN